MHELRIAENLIRLRHERKITQEELADYIGGRLHYDAYISLRDHFHD